MSAGQPPFPYHEYGPSHAVVLTGDYICEVTSCGESSNGEYSHEYARVHPSSAQATLEGIRLSSWRRSSAWPRQILMTQASRRLGAKQSRVHTAVTEASMKDRVHTCQGGWRAVPTRAHRRHMRCLLARDFVGAPTRAGSTCQSMRAACCVFDGLANEY